MSHIIPKLCYYKDMKLFIISILFSLAGLTFASEKIQTQV